MRRDCRPKAHQSAAANKHAGTHTPDMHTCTHSQMQFATTSTAEMSLGFYQLENVTSVLLILSEQIIGLVLMASLKGSTSSENIKEILHIFLDLHHQLFIFIINYWSFILDSCSFPEFQEYNHFCASHSKKTNINAVLHLSQAWKRTSTTGRSKKVQAHTWPRASLT